MLKDAPTQPPFLYEGFSSPNGTIVPDDVFDVLMPQLSDAELRVLLYIIRRTFGFKRDRDNISLRQLVSGITTRDGRVLDGGTGLSKASAARGLKGLKEKGIIIAQRNRSTEKGDEATTYALRFKGEPVEKRADTPLSQFETPPRVSPARHPRVSKLNTQQTGEQQTDNISNIRMAHSQENKKGTGETASHHRPVEQTISQPANLGSAGTTPANPVVIGKLIQQRGADLHKYPPSRRRGRPTAEEAELRADLSRFIEDFGRELGDEAPRSSLTWAVNCMRRTGVDIGTFTSVLYEARSITQSYSGAITKQADSGQVAWPKKNKFAYFKRVVEDLLGLKDDQGEREEELVPAPSVQEERHFPFGQLPPRRS